MKQGQILFKYVTLLLLSAILIVAIGFRFWKLDLFPYGLNWDEAAYGYNAYSLLQTGKDEWGFQYPLFLKSFGDYKPALLSYLQIPFIQFFGLGIVALRLPVAILSVLSIGGWMSIQRKLELFESKKFGKLFQLFGVIVFATAPWLIHYSRAAMDPIVSFGFLLVGFALFIQKNQAPRWFGVISLVLSMYTYNSARIFVPMLVIIYFCILEWQGFKKIQKDIQRVLQLIVILVGFGLVVTTSFSSTAGARAQAVFILNNPIIKDQTNESLYRHVVLGLNGERVFSNKAITSIYILSKNYLSHFDPMFIFFDNTLSARHGFNRHGNLLLITLPFLLFGLFSVGKRSKQDTFFLFWLLLAPVASALTDDVPHSGRTLIMLPAFIYFITRGVEKIIHVLADTKWTKLVPSYLFVFLIAVAVAFNTSLYFVDMFRYFPEESYLPWQGDARTIVEYLDTAQVASYDSVYVSDLILENYLFYALYTQQDPLHIQQLHVDEKIDTFGNVQLTEVQQCVLKDGAVLAITEVDYSGLYTDILYPFDRFNQEKHLAYVYDTTKMTKEARLFLTASCN
ncbi:MAG: hypothetical protein GW762_02325 [Candidatus Pacebacteria bacterium]|nr:hypothetical protein [Candidatus Paceibacterota bacterium]PIR63602.1 MAG: hypothetical protein COU64_03325 [Candidatus Pacebacteria bacterium CG10_big_fil_rev_8_21_14_0_10_40_26]PIZ78704.1 MAG: hypothetical protein COY01_03695 [Candidatus Pacebacteria bacterium CG_4_10_14_0_2_um_filter_40_20]PJA68444.1 MAG: hypothetical protein CO156_05620 [Candidatus Pacebacteria bacterium CG_4_9_14_3_um_filter_40_12]PJC41306.1 MAG: hypothetical protein CO041_05690 [Candidatus Pacebacteria bacterium CG_4_9_